MKPTNVAANWCLPHFCRQGGCDVFCQTNVSGERQFAATIQYLHAYALSERFAQAFIPDMLPRTLNYIAEACSGELLNGAPEVLGSRVCTDSRQAQSGDIFFALSGEKFDAHAFLPAVAQAGVAVIVAERAKIAPDVVKCPVILVENTRKALGQLAARFRRDFDIPFIAVGGSNGKTTVKELIASVLSQREKVLWSEASFNNDIGVPITLLRLDPSHKSAVIEAGTNHSGELAPLLHIIRPHIGVVTSIGREHLEFFGDLAGVVQEEGAMAEALPADGVLFLNGDNELCNSLAQRARCRIERVGLNGHNDWQARNVRFDETGVSFLVTSRRAEINGDYHVRLLGRHQVINALFAVAIGAGLGLEKKQIQDGLAQCEPPRMRLQLWNFDGVRVLDDCYNANADSMLAALQTLRELPCRNRRVAVLGDMNELGECSEAAHLEVGRQAAAIGLDQLFVVGKRAAGIAQSARNEGMRNIAEFSDAPAAAQAIGEYALSGDLFLIKASRSMRLERVTEMLRNRTRPVEKLTI